MNLEATATMNATWDETTSGVLDVGRRALMLMKIFLFGTLEEEDPSKQRAPRPEVAPLARGSRGTTSLLLKTFARRSPSNHPRSSRSPRHPSLPSTNVARMSKNGKKKSSPEFIYGRRAQQQHPFHPFSAPTRGAPPTEESPLRASRSDQILQTHGMTPSRHIAILASRLNHRLLCTGRQPPPPPVSSGKQSRRRGGGEEPGETRRLSKEGEKRERKREGESERQRARIPCITMYHKMRKGIKGQGPIFLGFLKKTIHSRWIMNGEN